MEDTGKKNKKQIHIFHLFRKDGTSLILHPFGTHRKLAHEMENYDIQGIYGRQPRMGTLTEFRTILYGYIDREVKEWLSEVRFIPKFVAAAVVFLFVYFVLSLVLRDPIPMLDEFVAGMIGAVLTYTLIGKRDEQSYQASKKREKLTEITDSIHFKKSDILEKIEDELHKAEDEGINYSEYMQTEKSAWALDEQNKELLKELEQGLRSYFEHSSGKQHVKILERTNKDDKKGKYAEELKKADYLGKLDIPLFGLYERVKNINISSHT